MVVGRQGLGPGLAAFGDAAGSGDPVIDALRAGSNAAWEHAVRTLGPRLRGFARMRGADDADEVVNLVFLDLARGIEEFTGDWNSFRTLAFVITRRRVVDEIRYNSRRPADPVEADVFDDKVGGNVEQEALNNLDREWLLDLLDRLTPLQRDVLTMRLVSGLTVPEVAAITGASETGVKANQRRAIASLRRHLAASGSKDQAVVGQPVAEIEGTP